MDINKNSYVFIFASVMVIIVAALLSATAIGLKPLQDRNIELEKKQNILSSVRINIDRQEAEELYDKYIKQELVLNSKGERIEGSAFDIELKKELKKDIDAQALPLFISEIDGNVKYIIPLLGKGLWGPIWGFISLEEDLNKVYGAVFDHKSETPGLGAEINRPFFEDPFTGKTIFEGEEFVSIKVVKGGAKDGDMHAVDGISGGTITSDGVSDMLYERLSMYLPYFKGQMPAIEVDSIFSEIEKSPTIIDSIIN